MRELIERLAAQTAQSSAEDRIEKIIKEMQSEHAGLRMLTILLKDDSKVQTTAKVSSLKKLELAIKDGVPEFKSMIAH
jgi:hypothetical protein